MDQKYCFVDARRLSLDCRRLNGGARAPGHRDNVAKTAIGTHAATVASTSRTSLMLGSVSASRALGQDANWLACVCLLSRGLRGRAPDPPEESSRRAPIGEAQAVSMSRKSRRKAALPYNQSAARVQSLSGFLYLARPSKSALGRRREWVRYVRGAGRCVGVGCDGHKH